MLPSKWRKSTKARFVPTLELLEKREVLDAALRFVTQHITVSEQQTTAPVTIGVELSESSTQPEGCQQIRRLGRQGPWESLCPMERFPRFSPWAG